MLLEKINGHRYFIWTIVFLIVSGVALISYLSWVNIELETQNLLLLT